MDQSGMITCSRCGRQIGITVGSKQGNALFRRNGVGGGGGGGAFRVGISLIKHCMVITMLQVSLKCYVLCGHVIFIWHYTL